MKAARVMTIFTHNSESLKAYQAAAVALHEFSFAVEKKLEEAGDRGNLAEAKEALSELSLRTKAFEDLRARLTPLDLFIAKYCVMALDEHTVSLVIPKGMSRIEMLQESQSISVALHEANPDRYMAAQAIWPILVEKWESECSFTEVIQKSLPLKIDGNVKDSTNMTRAEQEDKGWNNTALQDLAMAHAAFYLLTGKDLFQGNAVRSAGGALDFISNGLIVHLYIDGHCRNDVSASRSLSTPS